MAELNEVVADGLEEVAEQALGAAKVVRSLTQIKLTYAAIGAAAGVAAGAGIAWGIAYKRAERKYHTIAKAEIDEMRAHYVEKVSATINRAKPDLEDVVEELGYRPLESDLVTPTVTEMLPAQAKRDTLVEVTPQRTSQNVFDEALKNAGAVWDYAEEIRKRDPGVPYVIHKDEFDACEKGYTQSSLTYYQDDDVLSDERDTVIDDQDDTIGCHNLSKFGHGSEDPNIVYVRNDVRQLDVEICYSDGSFAEEVHGFKHSEDPPHRRRPWDG